MDNLRPKVFVDLDDTLLDTASMKRKMFDIVVDCSKSAHDGEQLTVDEVERRYAEVRNNGNFSLDQFCGLFADYDVDQQALKYSILDLYDHSGDYLIESRISWLGDQFPPDQYKLILLTLGDPEIQQRKTMSFHLENIFEQTIFVEDSKLETLKKLVAPTERFVIVDDRGNILEEIKKQYPQAEAYQAPVRETNQDEFQDPAEYRLAEEMVREGNNHK